MPQTDAQEAPAKKRLLFNKSGMAYKLKAETDGGKGPVFEVGKAYEPRDGVMYGGLTEEQYLLDYPGVIYADQLMTAPNVDALKAQVASLTSTVKDLTSDNEDLKKQLSSKGKK